MNFQFSHSLPDIFLPLPLAMLLLKFAFPPPQDGYHCSSQIFVGALHDSAGTMTALVTAVETQHALPITKKKHLSTECGLDP